MKKTSIPILKILPKPTMENPYVQLDYIFNLVANTKQNNYTKNGYRSALKYYKEFIVKTNNYDDDLIKDSRFYLNKYWDELTLVKLNEYIEQNNKPGSKGYLTSGTITGHISAIRVVLKEALNINLTKTRTFIDISQSPPVRETELYTAYSDLEMVQIKEFLKEELKYVYKVYRKEGYKFTGIGKDPRVGYGSWKSIDNMRWYFENVLNCQPLIANDKNILEHRGFLSYSPSRYFKEHGGILSIYRKWGVTPYISVDLIMPLVIQLVMQTGLNGQSVLNLEINCFEEKNSITGAPVIKYYKRRSGGFKEMHINLNNNEDNFTLKEFRMEQFKLIRNTIKIVLSLTEELRKSCPENMRNKLFIYESNSHNNFGEIIQVSNVTTSNWCENMINKYTLENDENKKMIFNIRKFRATKASELISKGLDVFELKYEMGHKNIETTLGYISKNKIDFNAKKETTMALNKIFENNVLSKDLDSDTEKSGHKSVFKGFLCDCKNPFDPPEDVKKLKAYNKGEACTRVNMCLFCENVLVFKRNLPTLWVYKRQIEVALERSTGELPNQIHYLKTLAIIEALFDENQSEFPIEQIEWAIQIAENLDELVDPVTYIPFEEK